MRTSRVPTLTVLILMGAWSFVPTPADSPNDLNAQGPIVQSVELFLDDGQVLEGVTVRRAKEFYYLTLESGSVLPIPVELVQRVKLAGGPAAPTGMRKAQGETLPGSGSSGRLPTRDEQRRVLKEQEAAFRPSIVDSNWSPTSDWSPDPNLNNFNPARWYRGPINPFWRPVSAFSAASDVTNFSPARWSTSPIDPAWYPTDGFLVKARFWVDPGTPPTAGSPSENPGVSVSAPEAEPGPVGNDPNPAEKDSKKVSAEAKSSGR